MYVRCMEPDDKNAFLILSEKFYSSGATNRSYNKELSEKTFEQVIKKHENLWGYLMLDKVTEEVLGYALVTSYWCNEDGGNVIILDELYIDETNRHKGYAKKFMEWIEKEFKEDAVSITLEVITTNIGAKLLYAKEGYAEDGFEILSKRLKTI